MSVLTKCLVLSVLLCVLAPMRSYACDTCKSGVPSKIEWDKDKPLSLSESETTDELQEQEPAKGSFLGAGDLHLDLTFEYRKWQTYGWLEVALLQRRGAHVHNFSQERLYTLSLSYGLTNDVELRLSVPFRDLRSIFVDRDSRAGFVGSRDKDSAGLGDLEVGMRMRLVREPFELYAMASVGLPVGDTHNRDVLGRRFEAEFQSGHGAWSFGIGLGIAKQWGSFRLHLEGRHTFRLEGEQDYRFGDSTQVRLGVNYQLNTPKGVPDAVLLLDVIGQFNQPDRFDGVIQGGHRARLLYLVPGIAARLSERVTLAVTAPIPIYQSWALHQEIDYSVRVSIGINLTEN